jgi:purine-nucleoside phosphorylase
LISEEKSGIHYKKVHIGRFSKNSEILLISGRKHFYEGYGLSEITQNIDIAQNFGVKNLIITNAAGGLNLNFKESDLMLITSYINFNSGLILPPHKIFSNSNLSKLFLKTALKNKVSCHKGIYGSFSGPMYETNAEIRYIKKFKIDAAGMSTIPELIKAKECGLNVIAVSAITNLLFESKQIFTNHSAVIRNAKKITPFLKNILSDISLELN